MKLLYCIPMIYNSGGMERVLSNKLNWLVENTDIEIVVVTTDNVGKEPFYSFPKRVKYIHLDLNFAKHVNYNLIKKTIAHLRLMRKYKIMLSDIIKSESPDICISMGGKEVSFLGNLKYCSKSILEMHFTISAREMLHSNILSVLNKIRTKQLIRDAKKFDTIVVLSEYELKEWGKHTKNVVKIANHTTLTSNESIENLHGNTAISVGRLEDEKDFFSMIDCWSSVIKTNPDWHLRIYGDGSLMNSLQQHIDKLHISSNVHLMGALKEIEKAYSSASVFVMTSKHEGLPMVLIEASTFRIPLVSYDCPYGPREIIENGKNGFLIEPNNKQSMINSLNLLIENVSLRKEMGEMAYQNAMKYTPDYIMPQWVKLFNELTNGTKDNCC